MVMIGIDGRPKQKPLTEIIREWAQFRVATVRRRCEHRLAQVNDRIHILDGRMTVYLNLDEVIALIRASDEPKAAPIARFSLSERQADDILEIRLRQLAKMEGIKIERELQQLKNEGEELNKLLGSNLLMHKLVAKEINDDIKTFGDDRRTLIKAVRFQRCLLYGRAIVVCAGRAIARLRLCCHVLLLRLTERGRCIEYLCSAYQRPAKPAMPMQLPDQLHLITSWRGIDRFPLWRWRHPCG